MQKYFETLELDFPARNASVADMLDDAARLVTADVTVYAELTADGPVITFVGLPDQLELAEAQLFGL